VAFIGYGDPSFYQWIDGGISTIQVPVERLALGAVEMITTILSMRRTEASIDGAPGIV